MGVNATTFVPTYVSGEVLTAADLNVTNSGIPVFADSSARDAAFGGTGEKVLAEGQYAYLESTKQTLVYDGSNWVSVGVAPGLVLIKTQTIDTGVGTIVVTDAFSADYDAYKITITGGVGTAANNNFTAILTGSTTGYYYAAVYTSYNTSVGGIGGSNVTKWQTWGAIDTNSINLNVELQSPFLAENTTFQTSAPRTGIGASVTGLHTVASSFTGFTLEPAIGTVTGGTIRVYGYANS